MPTDIARYSIELFKQGGQGIEEILGRHADIKVAGSIYQAFVDQYPGRLNGGLPSLADWRLCD
jgi:hypothetical protein